MITILILYSIFATLFIFYLYWDPKFEIKLIQFDNYTKYEIYLHYLVKSDADRTEYNSMQLFYFKIKNK